MPQQSQDKIAIIGMACRFPGGANSPNQYWDLLLKGTDAISPVPADRWNSDQYYHPDPDQPGKMFVNQGGFIDQHIAAFDAAFFNMTPREAAPLDPQQRILLEIAYEAFEDAGYTADQWRGSKTGVYIGAFTMDNMGNQLSFYDRDQIMSHTGMSTTMVMLSNRIAHLFDLHGPAMTLDTACSSSMVSLHLACQALQNGDCNIALSGGVNMMFRPEFVIAMSKGRFISPEMHSKTFDASADGYVRAEGAGILVLKPLSQAEADGDRIYAVVTATGVNQDGGTESITLPSSDAQVELIREVWREANITADDIAYIEAHGTGTQAGDTTEAHSLGEVVKNRQEPCWVGSVKTNIGHGEASAGIASLIKTILCIQHEQIPPHLLLNEVNPKINFDALNIRVPQKIEPLNLEEKPYIAVNSFGYGGTNAHALLQPPPEKPAVESTRANQPDIFLFSARSPKSLNQLLERQLAYLSDDISVTDYAYTLANHRTHHNYRLGIVAESKDELREQIRAFLNNDDLSYVSYGEVEKAQNGNPVFVYAGMGAQSFGMARELLQNEPVFHESLLNIDAIFQSMAEWSLLDLFESEDTSPITDPEKAQPANFALQIALTDLWRSFGIEPQAVIGHSVGEISAAVAAGALSLENGVRLIYQRSKIQQQVANQGGMLAAAISVEDAQRYLSESVSLAAINSPRSVTLSGDIPALEKIAAELEAQDIFNRLLKVGAAYHSYQMGILEVEFKSALADLPAQLPQIPLYSTVLGEQITGIQDVDYWWRNCREAVQFQAAVSLAVADGHDTFIEISAHPVLSVSIRENLGDNEAIIVSSLKRKTADRRQIRLSLAQLHTQGYPVDWREMYPTGNLLSLPAYAWDHALHWYESEAAAQDRVGVAQHPILQFKQFSAAGEWQGDLSTVPLAYLHDHRINDQPVFPASGYIEAALALIVQEELSSNTIQDLHFTRMLNLKNTPILQVLHDADGNISLHSRPVTEWRNWTLNGKGRIVSARLPQKRGCIPLDALLHIFEPVTTDHYDLLAQRGLHYGDAFRTIEAIYQDGDSFLAKLKQPENAVDYHLHPAVMDAGFQAFILTLDNNKNAGKLVLPMSVDEVRYHASTTGEIWCEGRVTLDTDDMFRGDLTFCDAHGTPLLDIIGLEVHVQHGVDRAKSVDDLFYTTTQIPVEMPKEHLKSEGTWLILGDSETERRRFTERGAQVVMIPPPQTDDFDAMKSYLVDSLSEYQADIRGIVYLWYLSDTSNDLSAKAMTESMRLLSIAQTLVELGIQHLDRFAIPTINQPSNAPINEMLWGLGRVLANEHPATNVMLINVDSEVDFENESFVDLLLVDTKESELSLSAGEFYAHRFAHYTPEAPPPTCESSDVPSRLVLGQVGVLDSLHFQAMTRQALAPDEVEIKVQATALNFKDLMKVLDLLPDSYLDATYFKLAIGIECAGEVLRVGENVQGINVGDRVLAMPALGAFQTYCTVKDIDITPLPDNLDYTEAVVFTNFFTAYHSLYHVARLSAGERVLIHSASGGVGLAAIQVARWLGAEVIATAGTEEKREFLRDMGIELVSDSRSLEFVDDVMDWTGGEGVDVVLNSLAGEAMRHSIDLLAPFGRFIEIGKRDIMGNHNLAMAALEQNITFAAVDLDLMAEQRPDQLRKLLKTVAGLFEDGVFTPLPTTCFSAAEISDAFRYLSQGQHIGKIVVDMVSGEREVYPDPEQPIISPEKTYLVTGGFGGFGLETARWLVNQGAKNLALVSRSGAKSPEAQAALHEFYEKGVTIASLQGDIASENDVRRIIETIQLDMLPLGGVIHSAMVLDDALLIELNAERMEAVLAPKIRGAWLLHQHTLDLPLDFFVLYSSISAVIGNPRQGNYNTANAFLDGLAQYRHSLGLSALSMNIGPVSDVGVIARNPKVGDYLRQMGLESIKPDVVLKSLDRLLRQDSPQVAVVDVNWQQWMSSSMVGAESPRYEQMTAHAHASNGNGHNGNIAHQLRSQPPEEQEQVVMNLLVDKLAKVTRLPITRFEPTLTFNRIGMDSLMVLELNNLVRAETGQELSVAVLAQHPTIQQMAAHILSGIVRQETI